ncbi:MAG: PQQ-binding-like beta-propeller repeat protein, partial [Candidatus Bathyarchaeota archaeon]|nr:PQQ-binding-like beta-propeller repeat protein [Candidatus Bathyarchaeota archaeon]
MENKNNTKKVLSCFLAVLLIASSILIIGALTATTPVSAQITSNYGDPNNEAYAYPVGPGGSGANTWFNPGPAPNTPTIKWTATQSSLGLSAALSGAPPVIFDGKIFCYSGGGFFGGGTTNLVALNAQTGNLLWTAAMPQGPRGFGTATFFKVDDTHVGWEGSNGVYIASTTDGSITGSLRVNLTDNGFDSFGGGSVMYWGGFYSDFDQMKYSTAAAQPGYYPGIDAVVHLGTAVDCSDPTNPHVAWTWIAPTGIEALGSAPGLAIFGGYGEGQIWALNATNGEIVWTAFKAGNAGYACNYYEGKIYHSASSTRLTCWNATNGDLIFDVDEGGRAFFVFGDSLAYGMYLGKNIALPNSYVGAWDADTGQVLWRTPALYSIAYLTPVVADGKIYVQRYSGTAGGVEAQTYTFSCFDAFTGNIVWEIPDVTWNTPIVAYGNLYTLGDGTLYCISDDPADYPEFHNPSVINGQPGPSDISEPWWISDNYGSITGSPVAADGKVYFGSLDNNIYCLNANTGEKIWDFTTGYRVASTPAVVNGRVFTGADDGNIYALNAETGEKLWETYAGGKLEVLFIPAWQPRSSPQVDGGQVFVGSLDGNLYCLSASDGDVLWKSAAGTPEFPVGGTPLVDGDVVYVASSDAYLYAFNRDNGNLLWRTMVNPDTGFDARAFVSTPTMDPRGGSLWVCADTFLLDRINTTTGQIMNSIYLPYSQSSGTMTPAITAPAVVQVGNSYYCFVGDGFQEIAFDVTNFQYGPGLFVNGTQAGGFFGAATTNVYYNDTTTGQIVLVNATTANNVNLNSTLGRAYANETAAPQLWARWLGHQIYSSAVYLNDLQGPKIYLGDDVFSITAVDAVTGEALSAYATGGPVFGTGAIYNGTLYIGAQDGFLYAFRDPLPTQAFSIYAEADKGDVVWNNETISIQGRLWPTPKTYTDPEGDPTNLGVYDTNRLANASVALSLDKPDGSNQMLTAITDNDGYFGFSFSPTSVGDWGWVALFAGEELGWIEFEEAYTEYHTVQVDQAPSNQ